MRHFAIFLMPLLAFASFLAAQSLPAAVEAGSRLPTEAGLPAALNLLVARAAALGLLEAEEPADKVDKKAGAEDDNEDAKLPRWFVYRDADSKENHGDWTNFMPKEAKDLIKAFQLADKAEPAFGETCIRGNVKFQEPNWCGIAVSCTPDYWGEKPNDAAFNLKKATKLVFYARGEKGGESIQVKVAIAGDQKFGDSARIPAATRWLTLKKSWQKYELPIDPKRINLERVVTPFCFVTSKDHNNAPEITFYLDHIYFVMEGEK